MQDDKAYMNALLQWGINKGSFPGELYKFRPINNRTIEIIKNAEFYFASPITFNDPFDCNLSFEKDYTKDEIKKEYISFSERNDISIEELESKIGYKNSDFCDFYEKTDAHLIKNAGILSLSKSYKNITMWSHYAKNHEGLVFELDILKDLDFFNLFGEVSYKLDYEELSYIKDNREEITKVFLTKSIDWQYEKEIRIIDMNKNGNRVFNRKVVKSIIFGCKTSEDDIREVIKLCNTNGFEHTHFRKAKMIAGKFALDFDDIKKEDYL